jgi:hypothetical protein
MKKSNFYSIIINLAFCLFAISCVSTSQTGVGNSQVAATPVFISEAPPPTGISIQHLGQVTTSDYVGYRKCASLYGALANEARILGANAVFFTHGDRRVTATSWSAPTVSGQAYRIENFDSLAGIQGEIFGPSENVERKTNR